MFKPERNAPVGRNYFSVLCDEDQPGDEDNSEVGLVPITGIGRCNSKHRGRRCEDRERGEREDGRTRRIGTMNVNGANAGTKIDKIIREYKDHKLDMLLLQEMKMSKIDLESFRGRCEAEGIKCLVAVSYTHLTLPTILLV